MGLYDDDVSKANREIAMGRTSRGNYGDVWVKVDSVSADGTITIVAKGTSVNEVKVAGLRWGDESVMWVAKPSTLTGATNPNHVGPLPRANSQGVLFLSEKIMTDNKLAGTPKWPTNLPVEPLTAALKVAATSLLLTGVHLQDDGQSGASKTLDLMDPDLSSPSKPIDVDGRVVTVHLTENGFLAMGADFPWPASIEAAALAIERGGSAKDLAEAWKVIARAEDAIKTGHGMNAESAKKLRDIIDRVVRASSAGSP